jgi:CTP:molybdopterin cytidylyltransferase MocA
MHEAKVADSLWAIVLAAGASQRLGRPKQLVRWRGDTLIGHAVSNAQALCARRVVVVVGAHRAAIEQALAAQAPALVVNAQWTEGLASSLRAGVAALPSDCAGVLLLTCDQPLVPRTALDTLVQRWSARPDVVVASAYAGTAGIPAVLPARTFAALRQLSGDTGARAVIRAEGMQVETVPVPEAAFDVDDEQALRTLEEAGSRLAASPEGSRAHGPGTDEGIS